MIVVSDDKTMYVHNWTRKEKDPFFHEQFEDTEGNRFLYSSANPHDHLMDMIIPVEHFSSLEEIEKWVENEKEKIVLNEEKGNKLPTIEIHRVEVDSDPRCIVYQVEVFNDDGSWNEIGKTKDQVRMFLKGMQAMASIMKIGFLTLPEIPSEDAY